MSLLLVAALFQRFDRLQDAATGVLRGFGDTRTPMLWNVAGHWLVGLPAGYVLGFELGWGVVSLWVGLCTGLVLVGVVLVAVWWRRARAWTPGSQAAPSLPRPSHIPTVIIGTQT